jgi:hypothetical protein
VEDYVINILSHVLTSPTSSVLNCGSLQSLRHCSAFQYVMYIKSFLCPNNHVRVTIIRFLVFYLTTLSFAKLQMASLPDERHGSMGHSWNDTGREEPSELKGKSPFQPHSFIVYSFTGQVSG